MLVGIIADTHDNVPKIREAVELLNRRQVGLVIHCGDFVAPFSVKALLGLEAPIECVFGNNDGEKEGLKELLPVLQEPPAELVVAGRKFLITHQIANVEECQDADYIIYAHTHEAEVKTGSPTFINPGECGGWLTGNCTIAILEVETGLTEIVELSG